MSQLQSKDIDLEERLMNNSFYSYDKSNATTRTSTVPTSFMKNSPSIKALENILNEKSKSFNYNLNNLSMQSMQSTQTFQTAHELLNSSSTVKLDTIDASPLSHNDSTFHDEEVFSKERKNSELPDDERITNATDNEDTLIDDSHGSGSKYVKMPSLIPPDLKEERKSMLDIPEETIKPPVTPKADVKKEIPMRKFGSFANYETPKSMTTPSPRKSPHVRSSSAFDLTSKPKESPNKHKRSSTLTDLANFSTKEEKKSKFSFKSLFKKKEKKPKDTLKDKKPLKPVETKKLVPKTVKMPEKQEKSPTSAPYNSNIKLPNERTGMSTAFKSNTNINFIREVTEDNDDTFQEQPTQFNDDYDTHNLMNDPAKKVISSNKYGEEMVLEPSPLPKSNNPFANYMPPTEAPTNHTVNHNFYDDDDDIFGSPKQDINDQLLGDSLFPKSLNPQEVESIVSLERSRSVKSMRSSKRTSFVNYDGSDENIILFNDSFNNSFNSPTSNVSRSNSILKKSKYGSIDSKVNKPSNDEGEFSDLMEFSDFINFDNFEGVNLDFDVDVSMDPEIELKESLAPSPLPPAEVSPLPPTPVAKEGSTSSPIIVPSSPSIDEQTEATEVTEDTEDPIAPLNISPRTPEITVTQQYSSLLTPNLEEIETSPELKKSPILNEINTQRSYPPTRSVNDNGPRPISMSFKGLKGPSFGDKLSQRPLRSSDSHQSFNISFNDDSDYSSSAVGDGFGSSDEEEFDDEEPIDRYEEFYESEEESEKENYKHFQPPPSMLAKFKRQSVISSPMSQSSYNSPSSLRSPNFASPSGLGRLSHFTNSPKSLTSQKKKSAGVQFSSRIILFETYNGDEYDRHPDTATCNQLTPSLAQIIREEINELKSSMAVHEESRCFTHYL